MTDYDNLVREADALYKRARTNYWFSVWMWIVYSGLNAYGATDAFLQQKWVTFALCMGAILIIGWIYNDMTRRWKSRLDNAINIRFDMVIHRNYRRQILWYN